MALQGGRPELELDVSAADLGAVREALRSQHVDTLSAVAVGTPHFSLTEFEELHALLRGRRVHADVHVVASTGRETYGRLAERGLAADLERSGVKVITDTCTYLRPMVDLGSGTVLTSSAKWAWYAPMTLGVDVALGSLSECVESAVAGRLELGDVF